MSTSKHARDTSFPTPAFERETRGRKIRATSKLALIEHTPASLATFAPPSTLDMLKADGSVKCPRKGQVGNTIAWARCVEMNEELPDSCTANACRQHIPAKLSIAERASKGGDAEPTRWKRQPEEV